MIVHLQLYRDIWEHSREYVKGTKDNTLDETLDRELQEMMERGVITTEDIKKAKSTIFKQQHMRELLDSASCPPEP